MTKYVKTMTPEQEAEWERKARAGELFAYKRPPVQHGSITGYIVRGCRCDECYEAARAYRGWGPRRGGRRMTRKVDFDA